MSSKAEVVWSGRAVLGECPVWSGDRLWFVDIEGRRLHRIQPGGGGDDKAWDMPAKIGAFALKAGGAGAVAALQSGFFDLDLATGGLTARDEPLKGKPARFNDGRVDRGGKFFWCGTMGQPAFDPLNPVGTFYRYGADGKAVPMLSGLFVSNASAFSPDGRTMYIGDSPAVIQTVWAFDYDQDEGRISNRRIFLHCREHEGRVDGAAVDADGCYWGAMNDGARVSRFTPEGKLDYSIELPVRKPTMCCFGGPSLDVLYVTSMKFEGSENPLDGAVLAVNPRVKGLAEPLLRG